MDLNQQKLTKIEWDTTEIPVSKEEKEILDLIVKGYHDKNQTRLCSYKHAWFLCNKSKETKYLFPSIHFLHHETRVTNAALNLCNSLK